ncbi:hypothetical protein E2C01_051552 [Portunus trituberculatus]|uniref:Uncharacterized protein n=1 Tax=Portunus trituberculatus TaxID=210409 RepID=A0A5B7GJ74_PORTR|nr:hypothetical protein [Portunus trituberculatus]
MDKSMMMKIITTMIRGRLEYAVVVWSTYRQKDIKKLERIQKSTAKMVPEIKDLSSLRKRLKTVSQRRGVDEMKKL